MESRKQFPARPSRGTAHSVLSATCDGSWRRSSWPPAEAVSRILAFVSADATEAAPARQVRSVRRGATNAPGGVCQTRPISRREAMAARISSQVFECFLKCRYKAALKLIGEAGQQSAFELFERECQASALGRARQALAK